ncbi:hypothetical protein [Bartonella jaculi]|uniref:DUF4282 domain-containing protein n=1 Tax=Bartonella jaculi TaxID=686226 RepID=A0ABP9N9G9_9HYPH
MKGQNSVFDKFFDKKQLSLSWQDYKKIFSLSTVLVISLTTVCVVYQANWGEGILSFRIFLLLAWGLLCALLFLPIVLLSRMIVTGKLKKMLHQLEEEVEQQDKLMTALDAGEGEK